MVLLPAGLKALKKMAQEGGLDLRDTYLNLDGGFDASHNRKLIFNAGMMPNIKENPRNRKTTKRGRKRCSTKPSMRDAGGLSGPSRGKISSSGSCYDFNVCSSGPMG